MRLTRRDFAALAAGGVAAAAIPPGAARAMGVRRSHGESLIGELKYGPDFPHFDYVNPDAPKGGVARLSSQATFDSFNPFIVKGTPPTGVGLIFDALMTPPLDEGSTQYGLLAEWFEYPEDYSWSAFRLREGARWHDGAPITVEDVIFSFNALVEMGDPFYRFYYANVVEAQDMGDR
ncbi:MAG: ABC transporter substrate-binding protein, partial [Pseudomonadota bacterium]